MLPSFAKICRFCADFVAFVNIFAAVLYIQVNKYSYNCSTWNLCAFYLFLRSSAFFA
jgi:hypothetical protein